jgi:hypothetical protein
MYKSAPCDATSQETMELNQRVETRREHDFLNLLETFEDNSVKPHQF